MMITEPVAAAETGSAKPSLLLSILLICFNHEKYIERAVKSILQQDILSDAVEIIVADDNSSDRTPEIIRRMLADVPGARVRYLESEGNLGVTRNYARSFQACEGQYVAVLEGDDYWSHPKKLRRQIDFLNDHWECNACASNYFEYDEARQKFDIKLEQTEGHFFIDAHRLARGNVPSCFSNYLYRRECLLALPAELYALKAYDWLVNICIARTGPIGVLCQPMTVYRIHSNGTWSSLSDVKKLTDTLEAIAIYDAFTDHVLHNDFELFADHIRDLLRPRSLRGRALAIGLALLPPIVTRAISLVLPPIVPIIWNKLKLAFRRRHHWG